jgi:hypothetical protein
MGTSRVAPVGTKDVRRNIVKPCFIKAEVPNDPFTPRHAARLMSLDVHAGDTAGVRAAHSKLPAKPPAPKCPPKFGVHESMGMAEA